MVTSRPVEMIIAGPRSPGPGLGPVLRRSLVKNPAHRGDLHTSLPSHLTPPSRVRAHPHPPPPPPCKSRNLKPPWVPAFLASPEEMFSPSQCC